MVDRLPIYDLHAALSDGASGRWEVPLGEDVATFLFSRLEPDSTSPLRGLHDTIPERHASGMPEQRPSSQQELSHRSDGARSNHVCGSCPAPADQLHLPLPQQPPTPTSIQIVASSLHLPFIARSANTVRVEDPPQLTLGAAIPGQDSDDAQGSVAALATSCVHRHSRPSIPTSNATPAAGHPHTESRRPPVSVSHRTRAVSTSQRGLEMRVTLSGRALGVGM